MEPVDASKVDIWCPRVQGNHSFLPWLLQKKKKKKKHCLMTTCCQGDCMGDVDATWVGLFNECAKGKSAETVATARLKINKKSPHASAKRHKYRSYQVSFVFLLENLQIDRYKTKIKNIFSPAVSHVDCWCYAYFLPAQPASSVCEQTQSESRDEWC